MRLCPKVRLDVTRYNSNIVPTKTKKNGSIQYDQVLQCIILCYTISYYTIVYYTILYCNILHHSVQCSF